MVEQEKINIDITYCGGFDLKPKRIITKNDMVNICNDLNLIFTDSLFIPEPITEGGILFYKQVPYIKDAKSPYKSMRFGGARDTQWYAINDKEVMETWKDNQDIIFTPYIRNKRNSKISTFLKAFDGAKPWTQEELTIFKRVFFKNDIETTVRLPAKKRLSQKDNINKSKIY
tara:strand:+ start:108 stop:623 length:516 start_codon:yes stop_codon:yes gene_type:complete